VWEGCSHLPRPLPSGTHYPSRPFGAWILSPKTLDLGHSRLLILDPPLSASASARGHGPLNKTNLEGCGVVLGRRRYSLGSRRVLRLSWM